MLPGSVRGGSGAAPRPAAARVGGGPHSLPSESPLRPVEGAAPAGPAGTWRGTRRICVADPRGLFFARARNVLLAARAAQTYARPLARKRAHTLEGRHVRVAGTGSCGEVKGSKGPSQIPGSPWSQSRRFARTSENPAAVHAGARPRALTGTIPVGLSYLPCRPSEGGMADNSRLRL